MTLSKRSDSNARSWNALAQSHMKVLLNTYGRLRADPKVIRQSPIVWNGYRGWQFTVTFQLPGIGSVPSSTDVRLLDLGSYHMVMQVSHRFSSDTDLAVYSATNGTTQAFFASLHLDSPVNGNPRPFDHVIDGAWVNAEDRTEVSFCDGKYQLYPGWKGKYEVSKNADQQAVKIILTDQVGNELVTKHALCRTGRKCQWAPSR